MGVLHLLDEIVLPVADLEAEHARLAAQGVPFAMPLERQPWGGFMALVEDPDGNVLTSTRSPPHTPSPSYLAKV